MTPYQYLHFMLDETGRRYTINEVETIVTICLSGEKKALDDPNIPGSQNVRDVYLPDIL